MITSMANAKVKQALKLARDNKPDDLYFLVEGKKQVAEASALGILEFALTCDEASEGILASRDIIKRLSSTTTPQNVVGVVRKQTLRQLGKAVLILDGLQDPGNVGTLIRSARALGFTDCVVIGVNVYNPKVVRAAQGALFGFNAFNVSNWSELKLQHYQVIVTSLNPTSVNYETIAYHPPLALVLGNEGAGVSASALAAATHHVQIPIQFESLNVAIAGAILMHYIGKQFN